MRQNVLHSSRTGGASLNILSGFTTGNFSAYWIGLIIVLLMGLALNRKTDYIMAAVFFVIALFFVTRSFHEMRIRVPQPEK